ncbi:MAG TPA: hypothetical protein VGO60_06795 [Iamia sp.]|jgi:hypothetical protein|nr:hypothetical protein [Iamia sp.]
MRPVRALLPLLVGALALSGLPAPPAGAGVVEASWTDTSDGVAVNGTYTPIVGDFLGGPAGQLDDIIWYAPGAATDHIWRTGEVDDATFTSQVLAPGVSGTYTPIVGDFAGNLRDDILWYAPGAAADSLWISDGTTFTSRAVSISGTYTPVVLDDLAGYDDIVWAPPGGGSGSIWVFHGTGHVSRSITAPAGSRPLAGRFNDGSCADLFWYVPGAGADEAWYINCNGIVGATAAPAVFGTYEPVVAEGVVDGTNDGILWFHDGGPSTYWEGDEVGTWKTDVYDNDVDGTAVAAGVWVHLRSDGGEPDELLRAPGHPDFGALVPSGTDPLAAQLEPVVGRFLLNGNPVDDILWYAPGATAERLFHYISLK